MIRADQAASQGLLRVRSALPMVPYTKMPSKGLAVGTILARERTRWKNLNSKR